MPQAALPLRHFLLALAVVAVWGTNFVVIRIGLDHLPPLLFATLRFSMVLVPMAFFVKRPAVSWGNLAADGLSEVNPYKSHWWLLAVPSALLGITLLALNFVGEGLRERLDPRRAIKDSDT